MTDVVPGWDAVAAEPPGTVPPAGADAGAGMPRLPVRPDEGFPQAFRLLVGDAVYRFAWHVNIAEERLAALVAGPDGPDTVLDLADGPAFLVLSVARDDPDGPVTLLRRRLVPGVRYRAGGLLLVFRTLRVAVRNLNGAGAYGSEVVGGVSAR
ncbi:hypothetical protein JNUCC64_30650 [Streptomyces sp. JNUCC 64]